MTMPRWLDALLGKSDPAPRYQSQHGERVVTHLPAHPKGRRPRGSREEARRGIGSKDGPKVEDNIGYE